MGAKIVPIFHYKIFLECLANLGNRRQHAVGENISIRPGLTHRHTLVAADAVNGTLIVGSNFDVHGWVTIAKVIDTRCSGFPQ